MSPQRVRKVPSALTPASRKSLGEDVAERLREAILHGELSPGQRLREEELSERLRGQQGAGTGRFHTAGTRGNGAVVTNRGVSVVELTRNDLEEIYTLRSALEPMAITLAIQRGERRGPRRDGREPGGDDVGLLQAGSPSATPRGWTCSSMTPSTRPRIISACPAPGSRSGCPRTGSCCRATWPAPTGVMGRCPDMPRSSGSSSTGTRDGRPGDHGTHHLRARAHPAELPELGEPDSGGGRPRGSCPAAHERADPVVTMSTRNRCDPVT